MSIVTLSLMEPDYPINVVKVIDFSFRTPYAKIVSYVLSQNQHLKFDKLNVSWGSTGAAIVNCKHQILTVPASEW